MVFIGLNVEIIFKNERPTLNAQRPMNYSNNFSMTHCFESRGFLRVLTCKSPVTVDCLLDLLVISFNHSCFSSFAVMLSYSFLKSNCAIGNCRLSSCCSLRFKRLLPILIFRPLILASP